MERVKQNNEKISQREKLDQLRIALKGHAFQACRNRPTNDPALKPPTLGEPDAARLEGGPFQNKISNDVAEVEPIKAKSKTA